MRQRYELFINNLKADIGPESPVLFNYTVEELRNPTIVKNSYSQQLKLKGTLANNQIFRNYFRLDAAPGGFNPSKRVPFQIFADAGCLVEVGYCKLDNINRKGTDVEYSITLYGGLGGFLYSLQYNDDKSKTLADLIFLNGNGNVVDMSFTISRTTVRNAWNGINGDNKWGIVNFMPCYGGIPEKFDAGRALIKAADFGLEISADSDQYKARSGYAIVDLPKDMNEWQVKDLRSYLQRPVVSARGIIRAICNPANNGGYQVVLDPAFFKDTNPYYRNTWMTLKSLSKLTLPKQSGTYDSGTVISDTVAFTLDTPTDARGNAVFSLGLDPFWIPSSVPAGTSLYWYGIERGTVQDKRVTRGLVMQAVGYDASGNAVCGSRVVAFGPDGMGGGWTCKDFCAAAGYTPVYDTGDGDDIYSDYLSGHFTVQNAGRAAWTGADATLTIPNVSRVASFRIHTTRVMILSNYSAAWPYLQTNGTGYSSLDADRISVSAAQTAARLSYTWETDGAVRSYTPLTQEDYLSDTMSPAEFLLSYCKRFGLSILADNTRKVVYIQKRSSTYSNNDIIDISARVDRSREISITPVPFNVLKYVLGEDSLKAAYSEDYKARYGFEYGEKRLNTGYEFNADIKKLLEGSKFKTAPEVKMRDLCFLNVTDPGQTPSVYPAVFLNSGLKYHLFAANNRDTNELTVPDVPATAVYVYWDATYKTYDAFSRVQLSDKDGKQLDGEGVLVFYDENRTLPSGIGISDDVPEMYLGNNENPCWILNSSSVFAGGTAPLFVRFIRGDQDRTLITDSMEFDTPVEVDIPGVSFLAGSDVYTRFWANYMKDRYSPRTKVMTCYVNTAGIRWDVSALRRFYWIDGVVWVLNKIESYDIAGDGICKCEFVQVQNIINYTE